MCQRVGCGWRKRGGKGRTESDIPGETLAAILQLARAGYTRKSHLEPKDAESDWLTARWGCLRAAGTLPACRQGAEGSDLNS